MSKPPPWSPSGLYPPLVPPRPPSGRDQSERRGAVMGRCGVFVRVFQGKGALCGNETPCLVHPDDPMTPAVPDPTVETLSEAELDALQVAAGGALFSDDPIPACVERILAARAAAPDALRVRVDALAAEMLVEVGRFGQTEAGDPVRAGLIEGYRDAARRLRALLED